MNENIIIRKSPIVIIKDLISVQFLALIVYFIAAILANYEEIYESRLLFSNILSYEIAKFIFITLAEIILMGFIFLKWLLDTYVIDENSILHEWGVIFKRKKIIQLNHPLSIKIYYSKLSKFLKYGAIIINDKILEQSFKMPYITNPDDCAKLILNLTNGQILEHIIIERKEDLERILKRGEHERLEFKSSFRWDVRENRLNKVIEQAIMKTIAAFLNTNGGHLILGVDNNKNIIGLEYDYKSLPKQNADAFENHFTNVFKEMLGAEHRLFVKLSFPVIDGKDICVIRILPSNKPVYLRVENNEFFYIRTGNSTSALRLSELNCYIQSHWSNL
jgi:hypothetical protein